MKAKHRRTCSKKVQYRSAEEAELAAKHHMQHFYRCPHCTGWHCTKVPQTPVRRPVV